MSDVVEKPTLEAQARELLEMPPAWRLYRWEVKGAGVLVEGAVPLGIFKRGPRKGQPKWRPCEKEAAIVILNKQRIAWLTEWESKTGKCSECAGTTQEWAGWDHKTGVSYRPCTRCDATGIAPSDKPIARG